MLADTGVEGLKREPLHGKLHLEAGGFQAQGARNAFFVNDDDELIKGSKMIQAMLRLHADCPMSVGREGVEEGSAAATELQPRGETKSTTDEALKVRIVQVKFSFKLAKAR